MSDRIAPVAFAVSIAVLGTVYGVFSSWWGWFPAPQIGVAHSTVLDLWRNWRNDFALEPTRHLVSPGATARVTGETGFVVHDRQAMLPGFVLIAGLNSDQDTSAHVAQLFDAEGEEVHRWPIRYGELDPEGRKPQNVMLHGLEIFEDGSIVVAFDGGSALARLDGCGQPLWVRNGNFHHSIVRDDAGGLVTWQDERVVRVDENTGEELFAIDLHTDIIPGGDGDQRGYFDLRTVTADREKPNLPYLEDPFHPNDAEPLRASMAEAFPMFEEGDLLISLRELNMLAVVDPEDGRLRWWHHGPWIKQHDPDFQPDGTITVYDNGTGTGTSKIRWIDPKTNETGILFAGNETIPFYSWRRGKHQVLPSGNILVTEAEHGRVFEIAPEGRLVWERDMIWDDAQNLIITEARHIPQDFFADGPPTCAETMDTAGSEVPAKLVAGLQH